MPWETRNEKDRYFYSAQRIGKRIVKTYMGRGEGAFLAAKEVEARKQLRLFVKQEIQRWAADSWAAESRMNLLRSACRAVLHGTYFSSGYRQVNYCWRRPRKPMERQQQPEETYLVSSDQLSLEQVVELVRNGRRDLLPLLREKLVENEPIWRHYGRVGNACQTAWATLISGKDDLQRESIELYSEDLKQRLAGPNPTAAEVLLAERCALSWLRG